MIQPLVSVVIPAYNHGHFVETAVDSALAQTYSNVEVIVVDDGSTDDTAKRLERYGDRIRYVSQRNAGLSAARNTGIRHAKGEYIALLDSDDAFHSRKLEIQLAYLKGADWPPFVTSDRIESPQAPASWPEIPSSPTVRFWSLEEIVARSRFGSCGVVVRRSCFEEVGFFDETLRSAEDRDMWIRLATRFPIAMLEAPLWWYRKTPCSMSKAAYAMEVNERRVLDKAFAMPRVQQQWRLRRLAYGLALSAAGHRYYQAGMHREAIQRVLRSIWQWPLPVLRSDLEVPFARIRLLAAATRKLIKSPFVSIGSSN